MRRVALGTTWTLLLSVSCATLVMADVIPPDHHSVAREIRITNLSRFPHFVLIGYVTGPMIETCEVYRIEENQPLTKGYKFNTLRLFAIESYALATVGGLERIDFQALCQRMNPAEIVDPHGGTVPDDDPLVAERYDYVVESVSPETLVLKLERKVSTFNDGQPERIEEY